MAHQFLFQPSVEADRVLLKYNNYDEYLDSLVQTVDLRNLRSTYVARLVAGLGYRSTGETYSPGAFKSRRAVISEIIKPKRRPYACLSTGFKPKDPLMIALAEREGDNRLGRLNTVIFLRLLAKPGFGVSGYIDYSDRLNTEDWLPYFKEEKKLEPVYTDLSYLSWKTGEVRGNDTKNYEPLADIARGLIFTNVNDHMTIQLNPAIPPGMYTTRTNVITPLYAQVVLYDHVIRKKL